MDRKLHAPFPRYLPATYQLSTSDTLQQWEVAKSVTFTLMTGNNTPVPDAKVSYTISNLGGADIANTTQTGNDGTFTVNGVATKLSTAANVTVTVDGKQATTTITVTSASYSLTTTDKLEQREDARPLTFTLKTSPNNTPVRDADVSYTISGLGGANVTGTARTNRRHVYDRPRRHHAGDRGRCGCHRGQREGIRNHRRDTRRL